jgi:phosphatidate cytidylyltransferase
MMALIAVTMLMSTVEVRVVLWGILAVLMVLESLSMAQTKRQKALGIVMYALGVYFALYHYLVIWFFVYALLMLRLVLMMLEVKKLEFFWFSMLMDIALFLVSGYAMLVSHTPILIATIVTVACIDVGGYVAGKCFGQRKIIPWVSPNKTLEGYLGALVLYLLIFSNLMIWKEMSISLLTFYSVMVYILAIAGDLLMSFVKRQVGLKDTGRIIPGHGGILDRSDGWITVLPWVLVFSAY